MFEARNVAGYATYKQIKQYATVHFHKQTDLKRQHRVCLFSLFVHKKNTQSMKKLHHAPLKSPVSCNNDKKTILY